MTDVLTFEISDRAGHSVLTATGEIDLATAPLLEERMNTMRDGSLVLDLTGIDFIDSTGLRVILAADLAATEHGRNLAIVAVDGPVTRLFQITGVGQRLSIYDSVEAATKHG